MRFALLNILDAVKLSICTLQYRNSNIRTSIIISRLAAVVNGFSEGEFAVL